MKILWPLILVSGALLAACSNTPVIALPTTAKPYPVPVVRQNNGAIFNPRLR